MGKEILKAVLIRIIAILVTDPLMLLIREWYSNKNNFCAAFTNKWNIIAIVGCCIIVVIFYLLKPYLYDKETKKADRTLFNKIKKQLNGGINFMRKQDFGGSFDVSSLQGVYDFENTKQDPNYNFLNPKIEKRKKALLEHITAFKNIALPNTFSINGDIVRVLPESRETKPEFYKKVKQSLHTTADKICKSYDKFVNKGKRILKV
jgi:hypothetical protein